MKRTIATDQAPRAIGPYSQAVRAGELVFCSGQLGMDPGSGQLVGPDAGKQAEQCLMNLQAVLEAAGFGLEDVVKTTVFLTDMNDFGEVNAAYGLVFTVDPPARSAVAVAALPKGAKVEIEAIACRS
ncbi:MAG: RidA family protein [Methanomassiliicoccus sp.]|nr:RidA family protein [Methanomassiliicoccus sp.]